MKSILLQFLFVMLFFQTALCQTETFEDETANTTTFTTSGLVFNTTGDLLIEFFAGLGCNSDFWLGSGFINGGSAGSFGSFQVAVSGKKFILSTSTPFCAWTSNDDGNNFASGDVQFVGTLAAGGTISETISINPPDNSTFDMITFSSGVWANQELTALTLNIISGVNYIALDNIAFASLILPIELIAFEGKDIDNKIILNWQTATELNNERFEIEESQEGLEFEKIGEIAGSGTTLEQREYSFEVKSPKFGLSYFRLKQIDFDGQFEYSKIISVHFRKKGEHIGHFSPNPSKSGIVNLDYASNKNDEVSVSVFNMSGKLIVNQIQNIPSGENNLNFDFSKLNTGFYIVKIGNKIDLIHRKLTIEK